MTKEKDQEPYVSHDCSYMACMECGEGAKCECSCHGITGFDPVPKAPIVELLRLLLTTHDPCNHGSRLSRCKIKEWMQKNAGLLKGLRKPAKARKA